MILVVLGTHELPFTRLLQEVETLAEADVINEDICVQNGHTPARGFVHLQCTSFVSYTEMNALYERARVVISHGGTGSLITGIKKGKPVIAYPRRSKYGEHNDDHQEEIVKQFVSTGHILSSENLALDLKRVNQGFTPAPFESGQTGMLTLLRSFLEAT